MAGPSLLPPLTQSQNRALVAFSRVTAQDSENGEAWNNIAALSLAAGRPTAALAALQECVKHKRESWQVWDNLATVAARCEAWGTAASAATSLLKLTDNKRAPDPEVLRGLLDAVERDGASGILTERVGAVLAACAAGGVGGSDLWGLYARLKRCAGDETGRRECLARRLRALQDNHWEGGGDAFTEFCDAAIALADGSVDGGSATELSSVRMQLRSALKRAKEAAEGSESWQRLSDALERVTAAEDAKRARS